MLGLVTLLVGDRFAGVDELVVDEVALFEEVDDRHLLERMPTPTSLWQQILLHTIQRMILSIQLIQNISIGQGSVVHFRIRDAE